MLPKIRVTHTGLRIAALTTWQTSTTLTLGDDNTATRVVRLMVEPTTVPSTFCYVALGAQARTAVNTDMLVTCNESVFVDTRGFTYINVLSASGTAYLNVTPLENID